MYAPSHWMLDKLSGVWAPKPIAGPHKLRESMPLIVLLRNRLKYALTYHEAKMITMQRLIKVDGKVRTDMRFPAGFMDVVTIEKTKEQFRLLFDTKGRFTVQKIHRDEATYKLCRVVKITKNSKNVPVVVTHDGRTLRYPDPEIRVNDSVKLDIATGKITEFLKFEAGNIAMITGGNNIGRVGVISHREKHAGTFDIMHLKDKQGNSFATRISNVMVIGDKQKAWVSLPKGEGIKLSNVEDRHQRMGITA